MTKQSQNQNRTPDEQNEQDADEARRRLVEDTQPTDQQGRTQRQGQRGQTQQMDEDTPSVQ
jgi:hypothetical protein